MGTEFSRGDRPEGHRGTGLWSPRGGPRPPRRAHASPWPGASGAGCENRQDFIRSTPPWLKKRRNGKEVPACSRCEGASASHFRSSASRVPETPRCQKRPPNFLEGPLRPRTALRGRGYGALPAASAAVRVEVFQRSQRILLTVSLPVPGSRGGRKRECPPKGAGRYGWVRQLWPVGTPQTGPGRVVGGAPSPCPAPDGGGICSLESIPPTHTAHTPRGLKRWKLVSFVFQSSFSLRSLSRTARQSERGCFLFFPGSR